jgi:hypothetical protein
MDRKDCLEKRPPAQAIKVVTQARSDGKRTTSGI